MSKQSNGLTNGERSRSMGTLIKRNSGSSRMGLLLTLLMLPWYGFVKKNCGPSNQPQRGNGIGTLLAWPKAPYLFHWGFFKNKIYQDNPRAIAASKATITEKIHMITKEEGSHFINIFAFNSAFNWTAGI